MGRAGKDSSKFGQPQHRNMVKIRFAINLTKKQREAYDLFHNKEVKELCLAFSRQTGKTTLCEILCIETVISKKHDVVYITPTYKLGEKVYKEICNLLADTRLITKRNSSKLNLEFFNGSTLTFFSAESPQSIRGFTCSGALFIDEAAWIAEQTSDGTDFFGAVVKPITMVKRPKIVWVSTPNGKQGTYYDRYLRGINGNAEAALDRSGHSRLKWFRTVKCTIEDHERTTKEQIEEIKMTTPDLAFRQEYMVEFLDSALTVFPNFDSCFKKRDKKQENGRCWIGLDLSTSGSDSTVLTKLYETGWAVQTVIEGALDYKYQQIAYLIDNTPNLVTAYCESNSIGEPMINEIRKLTKNKSKVVYHTTTHDNKNAAVGNLQLLIDRQNISFDEANTTLYAEMGTFTYRLNRYTHAVTYAAKEGYHDDTVLSLLLALQAKEQCPVNDIHNNYTFISARNKKIN